MGRKKSNAVTIGASHMEDFIWMSYRYCIGRKTIAACTHADTIAALILKNPNLLSDERRAFMVQDIREQITNAINWKRCIYIDGSHYQKDVFSPLMYALNEYPDRKQTVFYFDANTNEIYKTEKNESLYEFDTVDSDYNDLIPWVKLANLLDTSCHRVITVVFDGKKKEIDCYPFPRDIRNDNGTITYKESWAGVEDADCVSICKYICDDYITEIESIE
jgi:hypothetical protein